ncbi:MAG: mechanosensitive ion channel [Cyanothece sp. SIO1E1]|nr:mechanosensitive ion channel [Cyanothece sp. SIO1E1]
MGINLDLELLNEYAYDVGIAIALLALIYLILYLINHLTHRLKGKIDRLKLKNFKVFGLEVLNVGKQELIIATVINSIQILVSITFIYFSLVAILSEIPATESIATDLVNLIFEPLQRLFNSFVSYLPDLFNIFVTIVIANYLIKSVKYISAGVRAGTFNFPGFHPRSARTTSSIITFLIYILTIIIILPSMPGYESLAFKGIATFLGALITIGGSSVIANYMAGIVLTYMHAFEKGDWVTINEISGKIISVDAFAVRLRSYKGEAINIPNSKVLSSSITNFSEENSKDMTVYTEVSIGYDVPWKKVNDLLIGAAKKIEFFNEKEPFVLQKKLDDFYIVYEINAFLSDPALKPRAYSSLHASILDVFNEAEIEIMSPHYQAERDGTTSTVQTKH